MFQQHGRMKAAPVTPSNPPQVQGAYHLTKTHPLSRPRPGKLLQRLKATERPGKGQAQSLGFNTESKIGKVIGKWIPKKNYLAFKCRDSTKVSELKNGILPSTYFSLLITWGMDLEKVFACAWRSLYACTGSLL